MNKNNELQHSLFSNFSNLITVRLDASNYVTWRFLLEKMLVGCDLMGYIDGSVPCPSQYGLTPKAGITPKVTQEFQDWRKNDSALITLLASTLSSDALSFIVGSKTSKEVWFSLEERYGKLSKYKAYELKISMQQIQKGNDSIDKYMEHIKTVRDRLTVAGVYISDEDIIDSVLHGLPSEYGTMKTIIRIKTLTSSVSMEELRSLLLIAEDEIEETVKSIFERSKTKFVAHGDSLRRYAANTVLNNESQGHFVQQFSSPSQSAASPAPRPLYMTNASSPSTFTPGIATYGGMSQVHNASFPQNSSFLQQPFISQLSAPYSGTTQQYVYGCFSQPPSFIAKSGVQRSYANGIRNGAQSYNGPQQLQGKSQSLKSGFSQQYDKSELSNSIMGASASTPGEILVGIDFEKMTKFGALADIGQNVNEKRSETLVGMDSTLPLQIDQAMKIDQAMIDLDKAEKKDELGVNVILAAKTGNEGTMKQPEELEVSSILNTTNGLATIDSVINSRKGKINKGDGENANFHIVSSSDQMKHLTSLSGSMRPLVRVKQEGQRLIESQMDLTNTGNLVSQTMELKKVKIMMNCRRACQPMELWPSLPLLPPG